MLYLLPIDINILFVFLINKTYASWQTSLLLSFLNIVVFPIYFICITYPRYKASAKLFFGYISLILFLNYVNSALSYIGWGLDSGKLLNPDSETMTVVSMEIMLSSAVTIAGLLLITFLKNRKAKER